MLSGSQYDPLRSTSWSLSDWGGGLDSRYDVNCQHYLQHGHCGLAYSKKRSSILHGSSSRRVHECHFCDSMPTRELPRALQSGDWVESTQLKPNVAPASDNDQALPTKPIGNLKTPCLGSKNATQQVQPLATIPETTAQEFDAGGRFRREHLNADADAAAATATAAAATAAAAAAIASCGRISTQVHVIFFLFAFVVSQHD